MESLENKRTSGESNSSASTTSLVFERIGERANAAEKLELNGNANMVTPKYPPRGGSSPYEDDEYTDRSREDDDKDEDDIESGPFLKKPQTGQQTDRNFKRLIWIVGGIFIGAWLLALVLFLGRQAYRHSSEIPHDPAATASRGNGKKITLSSVLGGQWRASHQSISWIEGADGEDGLLLQQGVPGKDYLVVEDIRGKDATKTLMTVDSFTYAHERFVPSKVWPSKDLKNVLIATDIHSNWRHSFRARYWIFNVRTQTIDALDPANYLNSNVQLASWSPQSDAIVFTRDNNLWIRKLDSSYCQRLTDDGGSEYFYGVPDWVYEDDVF